MSLGSVAVVGDFTIFSAGELKARLLSALAEADEVEVDLGQVGEMDSAGLQLMVAAKKEAAARGKALRFVGHSAAVVELLDLCDLAGYFGDPVLLPRGD